MPDGTHLGITEQERSLKQEDSLMDLTFKNFKKQNEKDEQLPNWVRNQTN